jgi:hypothetical protein
MILIHITTDIIIECFRITKVLSVQDNHFVITTGTFFNPIKHEWQDINL